MFDNLKIKSNYTARKMLYGYQLSDRERKDFDYIDPDDFDLHNFVRYKGMIYDIGEFMRVEKDSPFYPYWHGQAPDGYFSGVLIRIDPDDPDRVIVGSYYS